MKLGDVSIAYVEVMNKVMQNHSFATQELLAQYNIQASSLASPDAKISIPKFMRLGHDFIKQGDMPWLGLEMGKYTSPNHMGLSGLLAYSADNLQQAFSLLTHYELLSSRNVRGQSTTLTEQNRFTVRFYSISPYNAYNYFVVDSVLSSWYHLAEMLSKQEKIVDQIHFEFSQPAYIEKYQDYFQCELLFEQQHNQLIFKESSHQLPCIAACRSTNQLLERQASGMLEKVKRGQSFAEQVAHVISPLLSGKTPTLDDVSTQLNMAPWTLRRNLAAQGHTFQQVLNDTRGQLAKSYVCDTNISLGEIAYLVGFSSPVAFQHAFKRWQGQAPGFYRQQFANKLKNNN